MARKNLPMKFKFSFSYFCFPALVSGFLLSLAFPDSGLYPLAFMALVPLWISLDNLTIKQSFYAGLAAGLAFYLPLIYWISPAIVLYGGLNLAAGLSCLAILCIYLAIYTGIFALVMKWIPGPSWLNPFWGAVVWVSLAYIRTYAFTGFPWGVLGYSQYPNLAFIQAADIFGVLGISFVLVLTNGGLTLAWKTFFRQKRLEKKRLLSLGLIALIVSSVFLYGHFRLREVRQWMADAPHLKLSVAQANIRQDQKWDSGFITATIDRYAELSQQGLPCDLVVWPETALPFFYGKEPVFSSRVDAAVRNTRTYFLIGIPAAEPSGKGYLYYNRACMLNPLALVTAHYDKHHLVPFGEYVPLKDLLWFMEKIAAGAGNFSKGKTGMTPLDFAKGKTGVLICFEILFPDIARQFVLNGADILTTMTNDAWYGRTSAAQQHFSIAVFRAVENRRSLARSANTGISAFIDPTGKILGRTEIFTTCSLTRDVPVLAETSFFTRHGDLGAQVCTVAFLLILVVKPIKKRFRRTL